MSAYSQVKRQKVREARPGENVDYFQGVEKVEFNSMGGVEGGGYRHYSAAERLHARAMEDWARCSVCLTDFRSSGSGGHRSPHRPWDDGTSSLENYKRCIKALFDFCSRLGLKYWTAFDTDLAPPGEGEESRQRWDEMLEYVSELMQRTHVKLLWLAPDLHSHPCYSSGAFTSPDAATCARAAAQARRSADAAQRLDAGALLLAPSARPRPPLSDLPRALKLRAKMLRAVAEYKDRMNYRYQLLLMPCRYDPRAPWPSHAREHDHAACSSCLLRAHGLERHYLVCAPPGEVPMASAYNQLGGAVVTNDMDPGDNRTFTAMMKCFIDQGPPVGGVCLRLRARADADPRELVALFVRYIDAIGKGLRFAVGLTQDQAFSKQLQQRYSSYYSGFGSRLANADVTLEECDDYFKKNQNQSHNESRHETTELMLQRYLDSSDV